MEHEEFYYIQDVCRILRVWTTRDEEWFAKTFGLTPIHSIKAGSRTFRLYDKKAVDEIAQQRAKKDTPPSNQERVTKELEHEINVIVAANNALATKLEAVLGRMDILSDNMAGLQVRMDAVSKKLDRTLSELGVKL